jgi:F0F1-type ATP synthase membrane subunit a
VIVHVSLAFVFVLEVLVGHVRVLHARMIMLMGVAGAQMIEPVGVGPVIVGYMKVLVSMLQSFVFVLLPGLRTIVQVV